jgi:hypothetical protein
VSEAPKTEAIYIIGKSQGRISLTEEPGLFLVHEEPWNFTAKLEFPASRTASNEERSDNQGAPQVREHDSGCSRTK